MRLFSLGLLICATTIVESSPVNASATEISTIPPIPQVLSIEAIGNPSFTVTANRGVHLLLRTLGKAWASPRLPLPPVPSWLQLTDKMFPLTFAMRIRAGDFARYGQVRTMGWVSLLLMDQLLDGMTDTQLNWQLPQAGYRLKAPERIGDILMSRAANSVSEALSQSNASSKSVSLDLEDRDSADSVNATSSGNGYQLDVDTPDPGVQIPTKTALALLVQYKKSLVFTKDRTSAISESFGEGGIYTSPAIRGYKLKVTYNRVSLGAKQILWNVPSQIMSDVIAFFEDSDRQWTMFTARACTEQHAAPGSEFLTFEILRAGDEQTNEVPETPASVWQ